MLHINLEKKEIFFNLQIFLFQSLYSIATKENENKNKGEGYIYQVRRYLCETSSCLLKMQTKTWLHFIIPKDYKLDDSEASAKQVLLWQIKYINACEYTYIQNKNLLLP